MIKNNRTITVNAIAEKLGVTVPYLSTLFKNAFNITLKKYISVKKIERAKKLLEDTDTTISSIAQSLGYKSLRSFDLVFTKEVGVSPMIYRANIKNKEFFLWLKKSNDTFELGDKIEKILSEK
jgi:two-component system response regulator YesN